MLLGYPTLSTCVNNAGVDVLPLLLPGFETVCAPKTRVFRDATIGSVPGMNHYSCVLVVETAAALTGM